MKKVFCYMLSLLVLCFSVQGTVFLAEETDGVEGSNPTPIGVFDYNKEPNSRYAGMDYVGPVYYLDDTYYYVLCL